MRRMNRLKLAHAAGKLPLLASRISKSIGTLGFSAVLAFLLVFVGCGGGESTPQQKTTPAITWSNPQPINYGTTLSGTQLDATASVAGTFVYSPAAGIMPAVGTDTLSATFTPTDTIHYTVATFSVQLIVNPQPLQQSGTWTPAPFSAANGGPAFGLWLLTDGTVLSHGGDLHQWVKLTPDAQGNYANGAWTVLADSNYGRGAAQEHVLRDGRFYEAGGEYIYFWPPGSSNKDYNSVEIYDPVANTWTIAAPGLYGDIGDSGSATLIDGRIFASSRTTDATQIYDPTANMWTPAASKSDSGDEESWVSLPDGSVLAVSNTTQNRYDPAGNLWNPTGPVPPSVIFGDVGPAALLYDGRVFVLGSFSTALYTPGATRSAPGSWVSGPPLPDGNNTEDVAAIVEPNGKVMFQSYPNGSAANVLNEFDPQSNTIVPIVPPNDPAIPLDFLVLPTGQIIVTCGALDYIYTPTGAPNDAWRPAVQSVTLNPDGSYTLTGTQLSGMVTTGEDDMTMAENYPIVYLTNAAGNVYYCRSFNFSSMIPATPGEVETAQFTLPAALPHGTYNLYVSLVGVSSKAAYAFTY